jgi:hypothetical protein
MSTDEIAKEIMELPEKEGLESTRQIVARVAVEQQISLKIAQAIPGLEDIRQWQNARTERSGISRCPPMRVSFYMA